uniref:Protein CWC15 A n=2 Tax=Lygus hesperus TaxID=30085 RepID=A0A146KT18_LYGHE
MTTAHRATWHPAVAKGDRGGYRGESSIVSARDAISHAQLKYRKRKEFEDTPFQVTPIAVPTYNAETNGTGYKTEVEDQILEDRPQVKSGTQDAAAHVKDPPETTFEELDDDAIKAFGDSDDSNFDGTSSEDSHGSDSEDEEALLLLELEKLKKDEELKKQRDKAGAGDDSLSKEEAVIASNPLIASRLGLAMPVKRKWYDDSVFKISTRKEEP